METLYELLDVTSQDGLSLEGAEPVFRELIPFWVAALVLGLGVVWAFTVYFFEKGSIGWIRRILGALLRSSAIAVILLILLNPVLIPRATDSANLPVILLLDNSQSLKLEDKRVRLEDKARALIARNKLSPDAGVSGRVAQDAVDQHYKDDVARQTVIKDLFRHPDLKLLDGLSKRGPVQPFLFGHGVHPLREGKKPLKERVLEGVEATEARSTLADAARNFLARRGTEPPAALVIFTDGRDNQGKYNLERLGAELAALSKAPGFLDSLFPPAARAALSTLPAFKDVFTPEPDVALPDIHRVPIHIVGVGPSELRLLRIKHLHVPDTLFAEEIVSLPLQYLARGLGKGKVEISVKLGKDTIKLKYKGEEKDKIEISAADGDDLREQLTFEVPKTKGAKDLVVDIRLQGDKRYVDSVKREVQVADEKIKVLVVESAPRFQYKFLQQALLRDRRLDPKFLLFQADDKVKGTGPYLSTFPDSLKKLLEFNVIILGDVAPRSGDKGHLSEEQMGWIKEFVTKRGGLVAIAGRNAMPAAYVDTPLEEVLPVVTTKKLKGADPDERTLEYPPTLTEVGLSHTGMLALDDTPAESMKVWKGLQGFHWFAPIEKLRPGAEALLINPRAKMGEEPMPIMAMHYYGDLGKVVFLGSDETWRWRYNVEDKHFARFWGQILIELGKPTLGVGVKRVQMDLTGSQAVLGQATRIYARLLDEKLAPLKDEEVKATLRFLDAPGGKVEERPTKLLRQRDGRFLASLAPDKPGRYELVIDKPEPFTYAFRVDPPPDHELEPSILPERELRDLAAASGGRFYREEDVKYLPESVLSRQVTFTRRGKDEPLCRWPVFVLLLGLLTSEWLLRKFSDLS